MHEGIPFRSRHRLQWQIVLVNPRLLKAVQRRLQSSGPSHAIEEALRLALGDSQQGSLAGRKSPPIH